MKTNTFDLVVNILILLFFLIGMLWTWGWMKFSVDLQASLEKMFQYRKTRFKWMFLVGFIALAGLFIWKRVINGSM